MQKCRRKDVHIHLIMVRIISAFLHERSLFNTLLYDSLALQCVLHTHTDIYMHACMHTHVGQLKWFLRILKLLLTRKLYYHKDYRVMCCKSKQTTNSHTST